jgi:hypothetical protein
MARLLPSEFAVGSQYPALRGLNSSFVRTMICNCDADMSIPHISILDRLCAGCIKTSEEDVFESPAPSYGSAGHLAWKEDLSQPF